MFAYASRWVRYHSGHVTLFKKGQVCGVCGRELALSRAHVVVGELSLGFVYVDTSRSDVGPPPPLCDVVVTLRELKEQSSPTSTASTHAVGFVLSFRKTESQVPCIKLSTELRYILN